MRSSNSNTTKVSDDPSALPKAWLADLHKDFEAKIKATKQHEQMQAATKSKRRPKKRRSLQPMNSTDDGLKPLIVSIASSVATEDPHRPATKAQKPSQKHKAQHTKHNDFVIEANSVVAVQKTTPLTSDKISTATERYQVAQQGLLMQSSSTASQAAMPGNVQSPAATLDELSRRKNDEEQTIPSEDEHWALSHKRQRRMKKASQTTLLETPATVISSTPVDSVLTISAPLPDVKDAQEGLKPDSVPALSRPEQCIAERHMTSMPEISLTVIREGPRVTRPSTHGLRDTKASTRRYNVEELKAIRDSCMSGRLRLWDIERDMQHIFTKSSAAMLRTFAQYQSTLDQPAVPQEVPAEYLEMAKAQPSDKLIWDCSGDHVEIASSQADSTEIVPADPWTSPEITVEDPVPIVLLGLAVRARARKAALQTEVPGEPHTNVMAKVSVAVQPQKKSPSRRNKGKVSKPTANNGKLTYKPGEKPPEFLDLPFEVQTTILEYALLQDEHIHVDALFRTLNKKPGEFRRRGYGALFVCHHFHKIGREAYYAINTFTMSLGLWISLAKLMTAWPNIPRYANNIQPALMYMKHIIVAQLGPGEHGSTYGLWRHLIQFLRPFRHLEIVEIDLREPEYGTEASDEKNDRVAPVPADLRQRLQKAGGIRIGWAKKESEKMGIKEGALVCRTMKSQTQHWTRLSLAQVVNALQ